MNIKTAASRKGVYGFGNCKITPTIFFYDLKKKRPDLILMDIIIKGEIDGIRAARIIKELYNIPVIFLTGLRRWNIRSESQDYSPLWLYSQAYRL